MGVRLNDNDLKLLEFCKGNPKSLRQIAEHLGIAVKNVSVRIPKLKSQKLIEVREKGIGFPTLIKTKETEKQKRYTLEILKELKKHGGVMDLEEFHSLLPYDVDDDRYDRFHSTLNVEFSNLTKKKIAITKEGEKFLKENSK